MSREITTLNTTVKLVALATLLAAVTPSDASAQRILNGIANVIAAANGQSTNQSNAYTNGRQSVNVNRQLPIYVVGGTQPIYTTNSNRTFTNRPVYTQQQFANPSNQQQNRFNQQSAFNGSAYNQQQNNQQALYNTNNGNQGYSNRFQNQQANYNGSINNQQQQFVNPSNVQSTGINQSTINFLNTITGRYERRPIQNGYHVATITRVGNVYRFSVSNGGSWDLTLDMANQQLLKYYNDQAGQPQVDSFKFAVGQGGNVIGFHYRGVFFTRTP